MPKIDPDGVALGVGAVVGVRVGVGDGPTVGAIVAVGVAPCVGDAVGVGEDATVGVTVGVEPLAVTMTEPGVNVVVIPLPKASANKTPDGTALTFVRKPIGEVPAALPRNVICNKVPSPLTPALPCCATP